MPTSFEDFGRVVNPRPGRLRRYGVPAVAAAGLVGAVVLVMSVVGPGDDPQLEPGIAASPGTPSAGTPTAGTPTPDIGSPPPLEPSKYRLWLSETVVPLAGADVAVVIVGQGRESSTDTDIPDATFGVGARVDRWDGTAWVQERASALCLDFWECIGSLEHGDDVFVRDIGLSLDLDRTGPVEYVHIDGLDVGWYRLRQTANEGDEAVGVFQVVPEDVATVPIGPRDVDLLIAHPPLLPPAGGTLGLQRLVGDSVVAPGDQVGLEAWTDNSWQPVDTLPVSRDEDGFSWSVAIPALGPGAYRLVDLTEVGAQVVIWITADAPPPPDDPAF